MMRERERESNLFRVAGEVFNRRPLVLYSFTSILLLLFFFLIQLALNKSLIWQNDGSTQWYPNLCLLHDTILQIIHGEGFSFWAWEIGLGSDKIFYLTTFLFNPIAWICALFPKDNMEVCFNLVMYLQLFFAGFSMCIFMKHRGFDSWICALGAVAYVFSSFSLSLLDQFIFIYPLILFPLIITGIELILESKSPALLMIASSMSALYYLYFAFIMAVVSLVYLVVRCSFIPKATKPSLKIKRFGTVIGYVALSVLLIAPLLLPILNSFLLIDKSTVEYGFFPTIADFFSFLPSIASFQKSVSNSDHSYIGLLGIFSLLVPLAFSRLKDRCVDSIMLLILLIVAFIPFLRALIAGGSYPTSRSYFALLFFAIASTSQILTDREKLLGLNKKRILIFACLLVCLEIISVFIINNGTQSALVILFLNIALGLICYTILKKQKFHNKRLKCFSISIAAVLIILLISYSPSGLNLSSAFLQWGEVSQTYQVSALANAEEQPTSSFYRSDTVAHNTNNKEGNSFKSKYVPNSWVNDGIYYNIPTVSLFSSVMSGKWHDFSKSISNNYGYYFRPEVYSNDNRPGIDYLLGVKNFYLDPQDRQASGAYANSYFEKTDNDNLLVSKYMPSLGYVFNSTISKDDFNRFDAVQKEQLLLKSVVLDKDNKNFSDKTYNLSSMTVTPEIKKTNGKKITSNKFECKDKNNKKLSLEFANSYEDFDLYLSVKNLHRKSFSNSKEFKLNYELDPLILDKIHYTFTNEAVDVESFKIGINYGDVTKYFEKRNTVTGLENMKDYTCYLGKYDGETNEVTLSFGSLGAYTWDSIEVIQVPKGALDESMQNLQDNSLNVKCISGDKVEGTVNTDSDGVLFLSILKNDGWKAYVDGEEVDTFTVDYAFTGCEISAGEHEIELTYLPPWMDIGFKLFFVGVALLTIIIIFCMTKRRKKQSWKKLKNLFQS